MEEELHESQMALKLTKEELHKINIDRNENNDHLATHIQTLENKLLATDLENARIKEREEKMHK